MGAFDGFSPLLRPDAFKNSAIVSMQRDTPSNIWEELRFRDSKRDSYVALIGFSAGPLPPIEAGADWKISVSIKQADAHGGV